MRNIFINKSGFNVWSAGSVSIESMLHRVQDGYIYCSSSLNGKSWNTTNETKKCDICFPNQKSTIQLTLF